MLNKWCFEWICAQLWCGILIDIGAENADVIVLRWLLILAVMFDYFMLSFMLKC